MCKGRLNNFKRLCFQSCLAPKQAKLKRFMDQVKPIEAENLDLLLAEFFFGCNIPFRVVESKYFKKFVNALRPAYNPPHRRLLAGNLLDKTHEKIEKRNMQLIKRMDKKATLLVDGWQNSSSNRHYVATMLATSNDQKIFLESFNFSTLRETGDNLFDAVQQAIVLAKDRYDTVVYAMLTDNAFNMQKMGKGANNFLDILYSTCNAHSANLLAGDILQQKEFEKVMKKVMKIQKDFRRTALANRLSDAGGHKPVLSCTTRWTSQRGAAKSMIKNLSAMKTVTAACDAEAELDKDVIKPKRYVVSLLFNEEFPASVRKLLTILNPVAELTKFCQKSTASSADAAEKWLELLADGPEDLKPFLEYRIAQSNVLNTVTMTANYLHPTYRGKRLSQDQLKEVNTYLLDKLDDDQLESLRKYTKSEDIFVNLVNKKRLSPITFWHYAAELGHRKLSEFANDYLKIPASTALLERLFSNWAYVHSDVRNRLSDETSKKLVNMYFTLRSTDDVYDMEDDDDEMGNFDDKESESEFEISD